MEQPRFALLYDGARLERWHLRCLEELERVADLVCVVVGQVSAQRAPRPRSRLLLWYARRLAHAVPVADRFADLSTSRLEQRAVDFVLRLGRVEIPTGMAERARLGVWCFDHETGGQELPFFAEVYAGADVTRVALVAAGECEFVLEDGVFRTDTRSYAASRHRIENAIAAWPARACVRLTAGAGSEVAPVPRAPAIRGGVLRFAARLGTRRIRLVWQRLFRHPQWNVGLLRRPVESLLERGYGDDEVEWFPLVGTAGFLADPFGVERGGRLRILCEYFDYRTGKGRICALDHSTENFSSEIEDAFSLPLHMSYPYVLDLADGICCVPETALAREIALYRAGAREASWSKMAVLVPDFPGVDPTVFRHDDRWWLMCTRQGPQEDAELWVWHAPEVAGPWTPHELNPVKSDVRGARPGGTPFVHDGVLYRPAQDCSSAYGGRIALQRVLRLTPTEFVEEPATMVESSSSRFPVGPHTLTSIGDVVLVDGCRSVFVPAAFRAFLAIWARALTRRVRRAS